MIRRGARVLRKLGFYDHLSLSAALNNLPVGRYRITFRVTDGGLEHQTRLRFGDTPLESCG